MSQVEALVCAWCGEPFERRDARGQRPRFCRPAHRQMAYRRAHGGEPRAVAGPCAVDGCEESAKARGLCGRHYLQVRRLRLLGMDLPWDRAAEADAILHRRAEERSAARLSRLAKDPRLCVGDGCRALRFAEELWCFPHWLDALKTSPGWAAAHPDGLWPWEREGLTPAVWAQGQKSAIERTVA